MVLFRKRICTKIRRRAWLTACIIVCVVLVVYWLQHSYAHRKPQFIPNYAKEKLTKESDYETFFLQTGLGRDTVDNLLMKKDFQTILDMQKQFFEPPRIECKSILGWFTKEDRITETNKPVLVDLQPGDILLTLSTHSLGWRHGHAGLVIDEKQVLECGVWGQNSSFVSAECWNSYSNFVVLRVKDVKQKRQAVAEYAKEHLHGVPYHLSAGFIGPKAAETDKAYFGLQCAYLVWYAWNKYGYNLDTNGGRLVLASDLLSSDYVEVVQVYGMDPGFFIKNG